MRRRTGRPGSPTTRPQARTGSRTTTGTGIVDSGEAVNANRYNVFDATLLKAAYNYQVAQKEPCGYVHNPRYVLQLLYDSIRDLDRRPWARPRF